MNGLGEWLWESLLLFLRLAVITSIIAIAGVAISAALQWWNQARPVAAWTAAAGVFSLIVAGWFWLW